MLTLAHILRDIRLCSEKDQSGDGESMCNSKLRELCGGMGSVGLSSPSHTPLQLVASSSSLGKQPEFPQQQNECGLDLRQDFHREVVMTEET